MPAEHASPEAHKAAPRQPGGCMPPPPHGAPSPSDIRAAASTAPVFPSSSSSTPLQPKGASPPHGALSPSYPAAWGASSPSPRPGQALPRVFCIGVQASSGETRSDLEAGVAREGSVGGQALPGGSAESALSPQQQPRGASKGILAYSNGGPIGSGTVSGGSSSGDAGGPGGEPWSAPESASPRSMRAANTQSRAVLWPEPVGEVSILQPPAPRRPLPFPAVSDSEEEEEEEAGRGPSTWDVRRDWGSSSDEEGEAPPEPAATPAVDLGPAFPNPGTDRLPARPLRLRVEGHLSGKLGGLPECLPLVGPWVLSNNARAFPGTDCVADLQVGGEGGG